MAEPDKKKKIKGFKEFDPKKYIETKPTLDEAVLKDTVVISFGRMNPITIGHEKLINRVSSEAAKRKADSHIFLSHSQDKKKNPLPYDDKIKFASKAFGSIIKKSNAKTIIQIAQSLEGKYKNLVMVVGSDRVKEFESLLTKYNGKDYSFDSIQVVSAGERDPDSEGVEGMSASKMRELAMNNNQKEFIKGLPRKLQANGNAVFAAVRKGMNMTEEVIIDEMEELDEALTRAQRRKRSILMKRMRHKIKRGREKAKRRTASLEVLRKRARKAALKIFKVKFSKGRYADMSPGEKEIIDKRIEKISKQRIDQIAKKLLPKVKQKERERRQAMFNKKNESYEMNEASCADTKVRKKPHMLLNKEGQVKFDGRFKLYRKKVNESVEDLNEEILDLIESTEAFAEDYYKGVPKDKKDDREAHFKRYAEKGDSKADKDSNYKPAPGDFKDGERVKTKLSKHTKKYRQMYGEDFNEDAELSEDATASLKKKAEKTGMPLGILRKVYNRGVAAWKSGHRPGTTPEQWGHARVNSFVTKSSGTWGKADADLAAKVRKEEVDLEEKLKVSQGAGEWVKDFQDSDAPQFKDKSDKKKAQMAIAAFLDAKRRGEK